MGRWGRGGGANGKGEGGIYKVCYTIFRFEPEWGWALTKYQAFTRCFTAHKKN